MRTSNNRTPGTFGRRATPSADRRSPAQPSPEPDDIKPSDLDWSFDSFRVVQFWRGQMDPERTVINAHITLVVTYVLAHTALAKPPASPAYMTTLLAKIAVMALVAALVAIPCYRAIARTWDRPEGKKALAGMLFAVALEIAYLLAVNAAGLNTTFAIRNPQN